MKINMNQQPRICPICGQIYHEPPGSFKSRWKNANLPRLWNEGGIAKHGSGY